MKFVLKAVLSVTFFTAIDRILGFVFKIYLSRELGAVGMGVYQVALSVFFLLLTVTTSGLPLIVSKKTAQSGQNGKTMHGTVSAALLVGLASAVLVCLVVVLLQKPLGKMMASPESMTLLLFMLPGVLFSGVYAALRGNLWGKQKYTTMSIIEVVEQTLRILLTVLLFMLGFNKLKMTAVSLSASCAVTALLCAVCYFSGKGKLASPKGEIVPLLRSSVPITCVRAASSAVSSVIAIVVPFILMKAGNTREQAMYLFGASVGMALPLLYLPVTVVGSLAYVMIPTLSKAYGSGNLSSARRQIETAVTLSIVVAALFVPAFAALGLPVGKLVYDNVDAGRFLSHAAWLLIPVSLENIVSSMLNSLDLEKRGFVNYMIGSAVIFAVLGMFCRNFSVDVLIYALGAGWTISSILDLLAIKKRVGIRFTFIMPLVLSCLLVLPATLLVKTLFSLLGSLPHLLAIAISGGIGCVFMLVLSVVFGILDVSLFFKKKTQKPNAKKKAKKPCKSIAKTTL
ncbi:MAG: oligosaccharide flippase family protein [Clostridiales bacterium]|nr:oligosaccharide flippase family protein [Clostridiales bacterium]